MTSSGEEGPLKLLALDGGGIRGLTELLILKEVMHVVMIDENEKRRGDGQAPLVDQLKPCDYFDVIGGTSTGGIIALMLGRLRMDIDSTINHYHTLAKQVFSHPKRTLGDGKFSATKLEEVVKSVVREVTGNPESPLLEERDDLQFCRTFVCARNADNMNGNIPVIFRTYQSRETHSMCKIWEAARATSAAPTFFKPVEIGHGQRFIDGGLGGNNPARVVLDEAKALYPNRPVGCLLSIGTGQAETISIQRLGLMQRFLPTDVIQALKMITTDCEATHEAMVSLFGKLPGTYFRFNVDQGMQGIQLSEWGKMNIVEAHTAQYLRRREVGERLGQLVNAIRAPVAYLTIEQLTSPAPPLDSLIQARERKACPLPVASFRGRGDVLERMSRYFALVGDCQRVFVLHGLGGSGKSQLAFKFLQESNAIQQFSDVFYVDATNELTLETDLEAITTSGNKRSVDITLRWIAGQRNQNWLLFFDNADDVQLELYKFFPDCASGNILITTRNPELRSYAGNEAHSKVAGMEPEDATQLLLSQSRVKLTPENEAIAADVVQDLFYFPLAISQAGAFVRINSHYMSLSGYRELYRRARDSLLQSKEIQNSDPYKAAVYATWKLSYDKLDLAAKSFLQLCSVLHHEGISQEIFEKAAVSELQLEDTHLQERVTELLNFLGKDGILWQPSAFMMVIKQLASYSLIESDLQNGTYNIHPLVQQWAAATTAEGGHDMQKCAVAIIGLSTAWKFTTDDYKYRRRLLQHIINPMKALKPKEIDSRIAPQIARIYEECGRWMDSEALQVAVLEKNKRLLGDTHPDTLASMTNLAMTYLKLGHWKNAEALQIFVLEKRRLQLGDDHPDTLRIKANLAGTYAEQGRWKDAEAVEAVVLEKRKKILGDDHPDTLASMGNLASIYAEQGRWKDAEALLVIVLKECKLRLGDDHPDTLGSMGNLAATYLLQGRWKDAEALQKDVVEKRKLLLGDDHPDTLNNMVGLAAIYSEQGRWKDAEALEVVVLEKRKLLLGENHPDSITSMANLAVTYVQMGQWKDAEALQVLVLEKSKKIRGDDPPDTLTSMGNLAEIYRRQGRWKDAEALQTVLVEKRKQLLGDDHPDTVQSMVNLAKTYLEQGRLKDAEALEVLGLEGRRRLMGDDHPDTLKSMASLAETYRSQGRWKDAEALLVVVLEKRKKLLGDGHPDTIRSMGVLAITYFGLGRWKDAEALQTFVFETRKKMLGDDHPDTLTSMANLATIYVRQGYLEQGKALREALWEKSKLVLGDEHPDTRRRAADLLSLADKNAL